MADEHVQVPNPSLTPGAASIQVSPSPGVLGTVKDAIWSRGPAHPAHKNESTREIIETVVFVVVLVLLLKTFIAEAFVIPTGSMADTLWGYQKYIICPQCAHGFPVNCSQEVDPQDGGKPVAVTGCVCPNCRLNIQLAHPKDTNRPPGPLAANEIADPGPNSGDRVLVVKYLYDLVPGTPERFDVVVFKYPGDSSNVAGYRRFPVSGPQQNWTQMNYIKRLVGLPGETVGIWYGDLYRWQGEKPGAVDERIPQRDRWMKDSMHENEALDILQGGKHFEILRKSPEKILALRRIVYDNDQPAKDLEGVLPPRWAGEDGGTWAKADAHGFRHTPGDTDRLRWLRYRHILRQSPNGVPRKPEPELITDFLGYNTYMPRRDGGGMARPNWAGDLVLECEVTVEDAKGELVLELSRGVDRFRARFELDTGKCTLLRLKRPHEGASTPPDEDFEPIDAQKGTALTALKNKGTYRLRFANVDAQLVLWVDGSLVFGNGLTYELPAKRGPYNNDLEPASIAARGGTLSVNQLKLWRDTYYTTNPGSEDGSPEGQDWSDPKKWGPLQELRGKTLFAQPGHYICLGDNSPESSDSRAWGAVPDRLMLGRALVVYYPFYFPWWPLRSPVNRAGPIR